LGGWRQTHLDNLVYACRRHHRLLHEGGYRVTVTEKGELQFLQPDGRPLLESPGAPRLPSDPVASLQAQHRELGIEVNAWTATPHWLGERLDFDFTMWTLRGSEKCSSRPRWN
jgi:hypothetical protein